MPKKRIFSKKTKKDTSGTSTGRITKETIDDYRKEVISEGRKFKYPMQYSKHKLVIHTLLISLVGLFLVAFFFMWQLYIVQNTGTLFYRITQVIPLPVAVVDGQQVRYSDYLMKFRSERHYLETKEDTDFSTKDGERQSLGIKRQSMDEAIADAYAAKIAREKDIIVTRDDAREYIAAQQKPGENEISDQTLASVLRDYYGWSMREYEHTIQKKLLTQRVRYAVDDKARALSAEVATAINQSGKSFEEIAASFGEGVVQFGSSGGIVPKSNRDGGIAALAASQQKGQISNPSEMIVGDGYYIVKTTEINDNGVSYEYIRIPLTEFENRLSTLQKEGKIRYFITIDKLDDEVSLEENSNQ